MANTDRKRRIAAARLRAKLAKAKKIRQKFAVEFDSRMIAFVSTAFGVVAALFWQTAITDTIKSFMPVNGAWPYEIFVAAIVTLLAVSVIFAMSQVQQAAERKK